MWRLGVYPFELGLKGTKQDNLAICSGSRDFDTCHSAGSMSFGLNLYRLDETIELCMEAGVHFAGSWVNSPVCPIASACRKGGRAKGTEAGRAPGNKPDWVCLALGTPKWSKIAVVVLSISQEGYQLKTNTGPHCPKVQAMSDPDEAELSELRAEL